MELGATKDGRPMFKAQFRIIDDSKFKKHCVFMNRVIYGTKNDAAMIASVLGFLNKLEPMVEPEFKNYTQFAQNILDIYEEVEAEVELLVKYDTDGFNNVSVLEVYEAWVEKSYLLM